MIRPPLAILLATALPLVACTPPLTFEDARPFQACAVDEGCTIESLACDGCGGSVTIANSQLANFEALRGCWQSPVGSVANCKGVGFGGATSCVAGQCVFGGHPPNGPR